MGPGATEKRSRGPQALQAAELTPLSPQGLRPRPRHGRRTAPLLLLERRQHAHHHHVPVDLPSPRPGHRRAQRLRLPLVAASLRPLLGWRRAPRLCASLSSSSSSPPPHPPRTPPALRPLSPLSAAEADPLVALQHHEKFMDCYSSSFRHCASPPSPTRARSSRSARSWSSSPRSPSPR